MSEQTIGRLEARIREVKNRAMASGNKISQNDLTVLSPQNDPYRRDTPAGHRDALWFTDHIDRLVDADKTIHLRGLHYALLGIQKPNGLPYENTDNDWIWLQVCPAKAARWLG